MRDWLLALVCLCAGCAEGSSVPLGGAGGALAEGGGGARAQTGGSSSDGGGGPAGGALAAGGAGGTASNAQACPPSTFASGVDGAGALICENLDASAAVAVNSGCSVYLGVLDGCGACASPPAKWGSASGATCAVGAGADNTCTSPPLGGSNVNLFGLNTDGDVDDNDKLYAGFQCDAGNTSAAPCGPNALVTGFAAGEPACVATAAPVLDYVRQSCSLFLGWRDGCDGCTSAPSKWGSVSSLVCNAGGAAGNTCSTATLGADTVQLLGIDLDGDVDGNDKFYVGLNCPVPPDASGSAADNCPAGQVVVGIAADGSLACKSPTPDIAAYVAGHCTLYFGWNDGCGGCVTAPGKWGRVRDGFCTNDVGVDNTCSSAVLGADTVELFGLSTDGDVNDDDKLYVGFKCE